MELFISLFPLFCFELEVVSISCLLLAKLHCSSDVFISLSSGFAIIPHWVFSLPLLFVPWQNNKSLTFAVTFLSLLSFSLSHSFLVSIINTLQQGLLSANPAFVRWVCLYSTSGVFLTAASFSSHFFKLVLLDSGAHIHVMLLAKCMNRLHISNTESVHEILVTTFRFS